MTRMSEELGRRGVGCQAAMVTDTFDEEALRPIEKGSAPSAADPRHATTIRTRTKAIRT